MFEAEGDRTRRKAYHEAGHAVAGHLEGAQILNVFIGDPADWGVTAFADLDRKSLDAQVTVGLAGEHAEWLAMHDNHPGSQVSERQQVRFLLAEAVQRGERSDVMIDQKTHLTVRTLMYLSWAAVEALATLLIAKKTIGGTEAHAIIRQHLPKAERA
jgi:hypothetical protein